MGTHMLLLGLVSAALGGEILVYGPTNGTNDQMVLTLASDPEHIHSITVWGEDDWRNPPRPFTDFDAIVIGDPACGGPTYDTYQTLYDTREDWVPLIKGNIFLGGSDAGCHITNDDANNSVSQVRRYVRQAAAWAASGETLGLYAASDWKRATQPEAPPPGSDTNTAVGMTYITPIGDIRSLSISGENLTLTDAGMVHPVFDGITEVDAGGLTNIGMSDWRTSYHSHFAQHPTFPDDFIPLSNDVRQDASGNSVRGRLVLHIARRECDFDQDGFLADGDSCGGTDCDDDSEDVRPGVAEICDGVDTNCDGRVDEAGATGSQIFYQDLDRDGFGNPDISAEACTAPPLFVDNDEDCHDDNANAKPGGAEIPYDGFDNDCIGGDACDEDDDGTDEDGEFCGGTDCDDDNDNINTSATEVYYNGIDQNCSGTSDFDQDGDGFDSMAQTALGTDCDDFADTTYPGAPELVDGIDNNCNTFIEGVDTDGDGAFDEDEVIAGTDPNNSDSDDDGVPDGIEIGPEAAFPTDTDEDGIIDALDPDDDNDGIPTSIEIQDWQEGDPEGDLPNTDGEGLPNHRDTDSDGDSYSDAEEGAVDTDGDGFGDYADADSDGDTVPDAEERDLDSDSDGLQDRVDDDDDNDGIPTAVENAWPESDVDDDDVPNWLDDDSDSDGTRDDIELADDDDCDDIPNFADPDDLDGPCALPDAVLRGGSCSAVPGTPSALWLTPLLVLAAVRRRKCD